MCTRRKLDECCGIERETVGLQCEVRLGDAVSEG